MVINSGLYIIDKYYCKKYIRCHLKSNNKTNNLIDSELLYLMLINCINNNLFIQLPLVNKDIKFDILKMLSD